MALPSSAPTPRAGAKSLGLRSAARLIGVVLAVFAVTAVDAGLLHVNSVTAGFSFLVLILGIATRLGLRESIAASLASVAVYNFFFFQPVGTFTIADPQNWVALFAFLLTAITASRLSASARARAEQAHARQNELQRMYDFSRGLMLGEETQSLPDHVVKQIVESLGVENAWFYDAASGRTSKIENPDWPLPDAVLAQVAETGQLVRNPTNAALIVPVRLGGACLGSLAVAGQVGVTEVGLQAIAQLVAIAIERARVQQVATRAEATRQNEQLKSTLLDALAHEFKTPLTSVKAAATTLLSSPDLNASAQRELLTIVDEEADRMTKLVSDSIELVRIGTAPLALHYEPCSPEQLIFSALESLRSLFEGRELKVRFSPNLPVIIVDKTRSELALRQVLNNALKYSPVDSEIRVSAEATGDGVVVGISNGGPGIPKSEQDRIFEKFYRGPNERTRVPGTGMGLSIAREVVEAQGGRIWVSSEGQDGTTFFISFPLHKPAQLLGKGARQKQT